MTTNNGNDKCKICGISKDKYFTETGLNFYDSGSTGRPICSKLCYGIFFDKSILEIKIDRYQTDIYRGVNKKAKEITNDNF